MNKEVIKPDKNTFIKIANTRIKISNIKEFGVSTYTEEIEKKKKSVDEILYELDPENHSKFKHTYLSQFITYIFKKIIGLFIKPKPLKKIRYLYLTTYQKDNHVWYEDEINIDKILVTLDAAVLN